MWVSDELASISSMRFTLGMDEDQYRLKYDIYCVYVALLGSLKVWDSPSIGVRVKLFQE